MLTRQRVNSVTCDSKKKQTQNVNDFKEKRVLIKMDFVYCVNVLLQ